MSKKKFNAIPFESFLAAAGADFELMMAEYGTGIASTEKYNFRYTTDTVEIGVRATFDRWSNSVDFACRPVPATEEDFDALMQALDKVITEKRAMDSEGSFDIWPFVRQARRHQRNARRLQVAS